jgi:hypothetical protein
MGGIPFMKKMKKTKEVKWIQEPTTEMIPAPKNTRVATKIIIGGRLSSFLRKNLPRITVNTGSAARMATE